MSEVIDLVWLLLVVGLIGVGSGLIGFLCGKKYIRNTNLCIPNNAIERVRVGSSNLEEYRRLKGCVLDIKNDAINEFGDFWRVTDPLE